MTLNSGFIPARTIPSARLTPPGAAPTRPRPAGRAHALWSATPHTRPFRGSPDPPSRRRPTVILPVPIWNRMRLGRTRHDADDETDRKIRLHLATDMFTVIAFRRLPARFGADCGGRILSRGGNAPWPQVSWLANWGPGNGRPTTIARNAGRPSATTRRAANSSCVSFGTRRRERISSESRWLRCSSDVRVGRLGSESAEERPHVPDDGTFDVVDLKQTLAFWRTRYGLWEL